MRRRTLEARQRGEHADYEENLRLMRERDRFDSTRALAPLMPASDARVLDTTDLTAGEVLARAMSLVEHADGGNSSG